MMAATLKKYKRDQNKQTKIISQTDAAQTEESLTVY
jgi:hypothetical protein